MSSFTTVVDADRTCVCVSLVRQDAPERTTVLAKWTFDRLTADIHLIWTVPGRKALSVAQRIAFAFRALSLTRRICA